MNHKHHHENELVDLLNSDQDPIIWNGEQFTRKQFLVNYSELQDFASKLDKISVQLTEINPSELNLTISHDHPTNSARSLL